MPCQAILSAFRARQRLAVMGQAARQQQKRKQVNKNHEVCRLTNCWWCN
jgi:hypothetical protein